MLFILIATLVSLISSEKCTDTKRGRIQFYFDPAHWTCFAYPIDCEASFKTEFKLYETEEECTAKNMVLLWKTYHISCAPHQRMATYRRTNGDRVPYIFSSALCSSRTLSDLCDPSESCISHAGFAYCCGNTAYLGEGPTKGSFLFTGMRNKSKDQTALAHLPRSLPAESVVTEAPEPAPEDCNVDGDRREIEWFARPGMACLSRRKQCSRPAFTRDSVNVTYATQKECMDEHFPNLKMSYRLTCSPGYSAAATEETAIIFSKDQCGHMHHSDVCNRDEYCAFNQHSQYAFCCKPSQKYHIVSYSVFGKYYRRRNKRSSIIVRIGD